MLRTTSNRTSAPAGRMPAANRAALSAWSDPSVATRADIPGARAGPCGADSTSAWLITPPFELGHSEPSGSFVPEQKGGSHGQPAWGLPGRMDAHSGAGGTTTTGQGARWTTAWLTDPSSNPAKPPRPRVP